jgi:hypothetical protein
MSLQIKEVRSKNDLRRFIYLPEKIHKGHSGWVSPLYSNEWNYFNPAKNRALTYSGYKMYLAYLNGKPAGRIMGIINERCNEYRNEKNARFGYFECPDKQDMAHELLSSVERWATDRGMTKLVGPMGFYNQDPSGLLIEGYEYNPTINTNYNFEFVHRLLEKEGYSKEVDYVVYKIDLMKEIPGFYSAIYNRVVNRGEYVLAGFRKRKDLGLFIMPILGLMNECFAELYGFNPLDNEEMKLLAKRFMPVLDPRFVKVVTKDGKVIGFNIAMPNLSEGIRRAKGRLFPFGMFHILRAAKQTRQLDSLIGGIRKEYRGRGIDVLMGYPTLLGARKAGFLFADSHHELEENTKVRAEMERLGGEVYKRFRIYQKELHT